MPLSLKNRLSWMPVFWLAAAACAQDANNPVSPRTIGGSVAFDTEVSNAVEVCHDPDGNAQVILIGIDTLPNYLSSHPTDYVAGYQVDHAATASGDGIHFTRITDALEAFRARRTSRGELAAASCRVTIRVAAGTYRGRFTASNDPTVELFPLSINAPNVALQGGLRLVSDAGRATAIAENDANVPRLLPDSGMVGSGQAIVVVTNRADGSRGDNVTIDGFAFASGNLTTAGGFGVFAMRAKGLVVRNNRFETRITSAVDVRETDATIERNYASQLGTSCAFCLAGPGTFTVEGNGISQGGQVGVLVTGPVQITPLPSGVLPYTVPATSSATATIENNDIRGHVLAGSGQLVGTGVRITPIGTGASGVNGSLDVHVIENTLADNSFGVSVDAGSPPPDRALTGSVDLTLDRNAMSGSCENNVLVSFQRHQVALGLPNANTGILRDARYTVHLGSALALSDVWYDNPTTDPKNTLTIDGDTITGTRHHYGTPCHVKPTAAIAAPVISNTGRTVAFDGSGSSGPNLTYAWSFGDDSTGTGATPTHTYARAGIYNVRLVVTNDFGTSDTTTVTIAPASVRLGLKNSDDAGTKFDLLVELMKNGVVISENQLNGVSGGSSGINNAALRELNLPAPSFTAGDIIGVRVKVRIAVGVAGHSSGTARLWYGSVSANSKVIVIIKDVKHEFFLTKSSVLTLSETPGPVALSADVLVNKNVGGNPFKEFGTWTVTAGP